MFTGMNVTTLVALVLWGAIIVTACELGKFTHHAAASFVILDANGNVAR